VTVTPATELRARCELLRSLHRRGDPLVLPNAWDVATAKAVVAAGFAVVATTSWAVAAALGYEDGERAPADEMLAAAARIARSVDVPVTVDAEAGYGMQPAELVAALHDAGAAGCNLEDTEWPAGTLRDPDRQAVWLAEVREAALAAGYPPVINARVDVFFHPRRRERAAGRVRRRGGSACKRVPRGRCRLCVPDLPLGDEGAPPVHLGSLSAGEHRAGTPGAVDRRVVSAQCGSGQLGPASAVGRDGSLQGTAGVVGLSVVSSSPERRARRHLRG
jgi:Phosphoenolpyruvate phosphomutase